MATLGIRGALAVNAVTFVLSALVLLRVPALPPGPERSPARFRDDLRAGLAYARVHPIARAVVVTLFLGVAFAGIDNVALVFLARNSLGAGPAVFGAIASSFGIGMLVASASLSRASVRVSPRSLYLGGWAMSGVGTVLTAVAPAAWFAATAQALSGAGNGVDNVASSTLIGSQRVARDAGQDVRTLVHRLVRGRRAGLRRRRATPGRHIGSDRLPDRRSRRLRGGGARPRDVAEGPGMSPGPSNGIAVTI